MASQAVSYHDHGISNKHQTYHKQLVKSTKLIINDDITNL